MDSPDRWLDLGVHWHAYIEVTDDASVSGRSVREERLEKAPARVFINPDSIAEWISDMVKEHAHPEEIHLIGPGSPGKASIGDEGHRERDLIEDLNVLARGDSIYIDFRRESDRMHLWVEAVTDECREVH